MKQSRWFVITMLGLWAALVVASPAGAESSLYRVAVLTPGLSYVAIMRGFREGFTGLDYKEGKNLFFFTAEETKGAGPEAVRAAARRLADAKPDVLFAVTE